MTLTYPAILRNGTIEWTAAGPPSLPPDTAVPVHVVLLVAPSREGAGAQRLAALQAIAAMGGADVFGDPVEWQREMRDDRVLFGREE